MTESGTESAEREERVMKKHNTNISKIIQTQDDLKIQL